MSLVRGDIFTVHDSDTKLVKEVLNLDNTVRRGESEVNTTGMDWCMINLVQASVPKNITS